MKNLLVSFFILLGISSASYALYSEIGLGLDSLGYQEHSDYVLNQTQGRLDSNANPSFALLHSRIELNYGKRIFGVSGNLPIQKTAAKETWKFNNAEFQTNDLAYAITNIDFYGGYEFQKLVQSVGGFRIARGDQTRDNFYQNGTKLNIDTSVEIINSISAFTKLYGETESKPVVFGYEFEFSYPLSVQTTNTSLQGFSFSASGYSVGCGAHIAIRLLGDSKLKAGIAYSTIHYDESNWTTQGGQTAKWPENNTQDLSLKITYSSAH